MMEDLLLVRLFMLTEGLNIIKDISGNFVSGLVLYEPVGLIRV